MGDDDPRCGASSLQVFDGEDLTAEQRKAAQQQQTRAWCAEAAVEKAALARREAETARLQKLEFLR